MRVYLSSWLMVSLALAICAPVPVFSYRMAESWSQKRPKGTECDTKSFRGSMLTLIRESPFIGLFDDLKGQTKFEASGITGADGWLWVVFDNLHSLGRIDEHFQFRDDRNQLVGEVGDDSQFEGLTYVESTGHFLAMEEVAEHSTHGLVPYTHELKVSEDGTSYTLVQRCHVHFELKHGNKGFEGIHYHEDGKHKYLMGLCEGNYCRGGKQGKDAGNGRIVVAEFNNLEGEACGWDVVKVVHIPRTAFFTDFSDVAFRGNKAAIVSQEDSTMWVGTFDFDKLEFMDEGQVYNFPRNSDCDVVFCNVEGVKWLDDSRLVISSDKAKKDQPYRCVQHEQRIHIFALPDDAGAPDDDDEGRDGTRPSSLGSALLVA